MGQPRDGASGLWKQGGWREEAPGIKRVERGVSPSPLVRIWHPGYSIIIWPTALHPEGMHQLLTPSAGPPHWWQLLAASPIDATNRGGVQGYRALGNPKP